MTNEQRVAPVLKDDALYLGDNGRCFCGEHAGCSARYSGRDISGQRVHRLTAADRAYALQELKVTFRCERCGRVVA